MVKFASLTGTGLGYLLFLFLDLSIGSLCAMQQAPHADKVVLRGPKGGILALGFSPSGQRLAAINHAEEAVVWSLQDAKVVHNSEAGFPVAGIELLEGDKTALIGYKNGKLVVVSLGSDTTQLLRQGDPITCMAISPDGKMLAIGSLKVIEVWDLKSKTELTVLRGDGKVVTSLRWALDSKELFAGGLGATVKAWSLKTRKPSRSYEGFNEDSFVKQIHVTKAGAIFASCLTDQGIQWSITSSRVISRFGNTDQTDRFLSTAYNQQTAVLAYAIDNDITFISEKEKKKGDVRRSPFRVGAIAYSPDGKQFAVGFGDPFGTSDSADNAGTIHVLKSQ